MPPLTPRAIFIGYKPLAWKMLASGSPMQSRRPMHFREVMTCRDGPQWLRTSGPLTAGKLPWWQALIEKFAGDFRGGFFRLRDNPMHVSVADFLHSHSARLAGIGFHQGPGSALQLACPTRRHQDVA